MLSTSQCEPAERLDHLVTLSDGSTRMRSPRRAVKTERCAALIFAITRYIKPLAIVVVAVALLAARK